MIVGNTADVREKAAKGRTKGDQGERDRGERIKKAGTVSEQIASRLGLFGNA